MGKSEVNKMEKDNNAQNKIVRTYTEDLAQVIEEDKSGLIKRIIHEEEEHEKVKRNLSPESKKNKFFMFAGLLFIAISSTTLFFFALTREVPTVPIEKQFVPLIFNDKSSFVEAKDFRKEQLIQNVFNKVSTTEVKNGGIEGIYLTYDKKTIGLRKFLELIKSGFSLGGSSDNIFINDDFLMGVVNAETKPASPAEAGGDFFILLKTRSLADIFGSLRLWESKMFFDLYGFFGIKITPETKYLFTKEFQDGIIENKNARILYDNDNKIAMMYVLANDTSVIIANTKDSVREIMLRLASSQIKK